MYKYFSILKNKLSQFIKRYYYNLIIKGLLIFLVLLGSLFLLFSLIEYFGYLNNIVRAVLFFGFIIINVVILIKYLVIPVLGLIKIGKTIDNYEAARILGKHFKGEIDDKIINTLQLGELMELDNRNLDILIAGIEQKSQKLIYYKFQNAVDMKRSLRFIPYAVILVIIITLGILKLPSIFSEPAKRIINYEKHYQRPAPFEINLINDSLKVFNNDDFNLEVELSGLNIPGELFIIQDSKVLRMERLKENRFSYNFRNVRESIDFQIRGADFYFGPYSINVLMRPTIKSFTVSVDPPDYTDIKKENLNNTGDHRVPQGSIIDWNFFCENVETLEFVIDNDTSICENVKQGVFTFSKRFDEDANYKVFTYGRELYKGDSLDYFIEVIEDRYPFITVEEQRDPVLISHSFFRGVINDDYGFTNLKFLYRIYDSKSNSYDNEDFNKEKLEFSSDVLNQVFYHQFNLSDIDVRPGETLEYFFEVTDNDEIAGFKSTKSKLFTYQLPDYEDIIADTKESDKHVKDNLKSNVSDTKEAYEKIEDIKKSMIEQDKLSWEQKEELKNIFEKKDEIEESIKDLKEFHEDSDKRNSQFTEQDESFKEKHEELQKLFEEVFTDEMKELYDAIQEKLAEMQKEEVFEKLDQMQFEFKDMERKIDRLLELYKQLELEKILNESISAVEQALEKQKEALDKNLDNKESEDIMDSQEDTEDLFDIADDFLEDFKIKNEELSKPNKVQNTDEQRKTIKENIKKALDELNKSNNSKAKPPQSQNLQDLNDLQSTLMKMQESLFENTLKEDAKALRLLMENLLKTSFNQEELISNVKKTNYSDPQYLELIKEQQKLSNDLKFIEDSLVALSKRQIHVQSFITREIADINMNVDKALTDLVQRRKHSASSRQQFVMMHINNLVLLLNESLQNMNSEMANSSGEGMESDQSGEGEQSFKNLGEMQDQMNEMLEKLQEGKQPMPGETGEGGMGMSEQLARMAAEQQAIRNELKKMGDKYEKNGEKLENMDQMLNDMERTEMEIIRNKVSQQTLLRQERIRSRLLEHERAEMEREKEERREGNTAKYYEISNPDEIFEYNRIMNRELEMLKNLPPEYKSYFKSLIENYFLNIDTE